MDVEVFHGNLPQLWTLITNAIVLSCKSPLLCNSISIAMLMHNSTISTIAMIWLSKQHTTENGVFQLSDRGLCKPV
jgi:hypothetical protein